jgi:hypothetical protein
VVATENPVELAQAFDRIKLKLEGSLFDQTTIYHAILTPQGELLQTHMAGITHMAHKDAQRLLPNYACYTPCLPAEVGPLREQYRKHPTGIAFILKSGNTIECWSIDYHVRLTWRKPATVPLKKYYVLMLNTYAKGDTFDDFFQDMHCDMGPYLTYYPEHEEDMNRFKDRLNQYALGIPESCRQATLSKFINEPPEVILAVLN